MARIRKFIPAAEPAASQHYRIPVSEPDLGKKEFRYVTDAMRSTWISGGGAYVARFEKAYARHVSGTRFAISVNSGTSALHLALISCAIGPGDEVILPTFTMIATANAVRYCGATPVFVDADPNTWNMDVSLIEAKISKKTKAIIPVHIYGLPADMDPVVRLAKSRKIWVIEDAAEAHGAEYKGRRVGSLGDVAAFSLFANKIMTTGEGGMITTNNARIAGLVSLLRRHAFASSRHFWHQYVGYSYEMTNLQAAVGLAQTERLEELVNKRRYHGKLYMSLLGDIPGIEFPVEPEGYKNVYWMYGIVVNRKKFGRSRDELRTILAKHGIETRTFFVPIHFQPPYAAHEREHFPVSERLCRDGLYLPSAGTLCADDMRAIVSVIRTSCKAK